jgi:Flp pilus assembly protein protease CpaA
MIATSCLLAFLLVAAVIDWRFGIIPNKLVYPGILLALLLSTVVSLVLLWQPKFLATGGFWGAIGLGDSLAGLLACGGVMLVCFVLFAGQVGGGDVKLLAMIGAWWGVSRGLEAMLWTLVIGAAVAIVGLIWKLGIWQLLGRVGRGLAAAWRTSGMISPDAADRRLLQTPLRLAPSAVVAVLIVQFRWIEWW